MYKEIYDNLCINNTIKRVNLHLHEHHILPKHSGGKNNIDNYTYLTPREHQLAHFLLWKIYHNVNDLRSMKMLGARLTLLQRRQIGWFCRDNEIGFFSKEYKLNNLKQTKRCKKSANTQKEKQLGTFEPEFRKKWASNAGKIGGTVQKLNNQGIHDPLNFKRNASFGGKALSGFICVTNGTHRTRVKPETLNSYLDKGYVKGFTLFS
jgi:hypothetical protein